MPTQSSPSSSSSPSLTACRLRPISVLRFWISDGWPKQNLNHTGWNSQVHRGFPGNVESANLSRDNLSREIGRNPIGNRHPNMQRGTPRLRSPTRKHRIANLGLSRKLYLSSKLGQVWLGQVSEPSFGPAPSPKSHPAAEVPRPQVTYAQPQAYAQPQGQYQATAITT